MQYLRLFISLFFLISACFGYAQTNETQTTDEIFANARSAYQARDELALAKATQQLKAQNYSLAPYADYWLMLLRLSTADSVVISEFLNQYADFPFADRVRGEWIKVLAKRFDWDSVLAVASKYSSEDVAVSCYVLLARAKNDDDKAYVEAKSLWMVANDQPASCNQLFNYMQEYDNLTESDIWARFRLALREGKISLAKSVAERIPNFDNVTLKLIDRVYQNPQQELEKKSISLKSRYGRELTLFALDRLARSQPDYALEAWQKIQSSFDADDRDYFWGRLGYHAARRHDASALELFSHVKDATADKDQLAWQARAALRAKDWSMLRSVIAVMPVDQQEEPAWRYWKARALKEQKEIPSANAILVPLSHERSYYGLLAEEELGDVMAALPSNYAPAEDEVAAIKSLPGIQRALELQRFDMRWEARTEWAWAIKSFDDGQMLAAAELAARQGWYDISINVADKTTSIHNYDLCYPIPYRDAMQSFSREQGLDEAWIYGLTRQESRFVSYAKSGVGASGLMQVMPATAKWVAKRMGFNGYHNDMIHQLDTNVKLGTYYLRYILDLMGGQSLLATAAYNAGPSRAKRWAAGQPVEGAVYAETIPIAETRLYVQKVMANAYFYAHRLGTKVQTLKQRLGMIAGDGVMPIIDETDAR